MKYLIALLLMLALFPRSVIAKYDPSSVPNNRYGIHIADINDLAEAGTLVNGNGGTWGYITIVIQENDMSQHKWQQVFDDMRRRKLIPIIRIATTIEGDAWKRPAPDMPQRWAEFLGSLNWPIENRYVIVFNEPNHAKEWGGAIDPEGYAETYIAFYDALRAKSEDFFIMPAAMDPSASNTRDTIDAGAFLIRAIRRKPEIVTKMDGLASHSYPNPGFSSSPLSVGKGTIASFRWELSFLKSYGLPLGTPVFITETGWMHRFGVTFDRSLLDPETVATYIRTADRFVWSDPSVVAVTPFIFNYQDYPFDHFSWKTIGNTAYYPFYTAYFDLPRTKGKPRQRESYTLATQPVPERLVTYSEYSHIVRIKNTGQAIASGTDGYRLTITDPDGTLRIRTSAVPPIEPNQTKPVAIHIRTPDTPGSYEMRTVLETPTGQIQLDSRRVTIVPPPSLTARLTLGYASESASGSANLIIYDMNDTVVHEYPDTQLSEGVVTVRELYDIVPGNRYRVVILVPGYLPRQKIVVLSGTDTDISFERLLPLDMDNDGAFDAGDLWNIFLMSPYGFLSHLRNGPAGME